MRNNRSTLKKLIWWYAAAGGGGGISYETVTGSSPLSLPNAVAKPVASLVQWGKCAQESTPTPSSPVPIKCNNGELKMVHQSGLPSDYKLLEYVGGSGSQYIVTDLYLASTDVVECEYRNSSTTGYGAIYGIYKSGESTALYGNQTYYGYNEGNSKVDTGVSVDTDWHSSRHDFVNGTLTIDETTVNFTPWTFVNTTKNAVLTRFYNGSYGYHWKGYVRKFKVTRGGTVVCDLLPAKDSNDDAGLYDLVSGNFYKASGGTLLEGNVVDDYYLAVVGTPEVLAIGEQQATVANLLGVVRSGGLGQNYADSEDIISGAVTRNWAIKAFDGTENWTYSSQKGYYESRISGAYNTGDQYLMCTHGVWKTNSNNTLDDHWTMASGYVRFYPSTTFASVDAFKAWVNECWDEGEPIILVYRLKTPVSESATPYALSTAEGDNTVSITANVSPIMLSVEYAKKNT